MHALAAPRQLEAFYRADLFAEGRLHDCVAGVKRRKWEEVLKNELTSLSFKTTQQPAVAAAVGS